MTFASNSSVHAVTLGTFIQTTKEAPITYLRQKGREGVRLKRWKPRVKQRSQVTSFQPQEQWEQHQPGIDALSRAVFLKCTAEELERLLKYTDFMFYTWPTTREFLRVHLESWVLTSSLWMLMRINAWELLLHLENRQKGDTSFGALWEIWVQRSNPLTTR